MPTILQGLPSLGDLAAQYPSVGYNQDDIRALYARKQPGVFSGGFSAGVDTVQALGGSGLEAAGKATGFRALEALGDRVAERNYAEAAQSGRPDLEVNPWAEGGPGFLPWLGYQTSKQLPIIGATLAGMAAGTLAAPVVGATAAAGGLAGGTLAGATLGAGSMFNEAEQAGEPTQGDAWKALGLGIPYGALETLVPLGLGRAAKVGMLAARTAPKTAVATVTRGLFENAAVEGVTEAAQTSMEMMFRPDLTSSQKADNIVNAAVVGGILGGTLGAPAGAIGAVRSVRQADPNTLTTEDLIEHTDVALGRDIEQVAPAGAPAQPGLFPDESLPAATGQDIQPDTAATVGQDIQPTALAGEETATLMQALQAVQQRNAVPETATPETQQMQAVIQQELAVRREQQPELFSELPTQRREPLQPTNAEQAQITRTPEQAQAMKALAVKSGASRGSSFVKNLDVSNEVELAAATIDQLEAGDATVGVARLAQNLGIVDAKGEVLDLDAAIAKASAKVDRAQQLQAETGKGAGQARVARAALQKLEKQKEVLNAAEQLRSARNDVAKSETVAAPERLAVSSKAQVVSSVSEATTPEAVTVLASRYPEGFEVGSIPNDKYLIDKLAKAEKLRGEAKDKNTYQANLGNGEGVTGYFKNPVALDPQVLAKLPGAMGEEKFRANSDKLKALKKKIAKEGYKPTPILVHVREDGRPFIVEGNHRVAEAAQSGRPTIDVKINYLRGAEDAEGPLNPQLIASAQAQPATSETDAGPAEAPPAGIKRKAGAAARPFPVMSPADVQDEVNRIAAEWKSPVKLVVVRSLRDMSPKWQAALADIPSAETTEALFSTETETIYIMSDNIDSIERVRQVLFHEALGHAGLQRLFKTRVDSTMNQMYRSNAWLRSQVDDWMALNPDYFGKSKPSDEDISQSTEEVLARLSEKMALTDIRSTFEKIRAVVKQFLRRMGMNVAMSDEEVMDVLGAAHDKIIKAGSLAVRVPDNLRRSAPTPRTSIRLVENISTFADKALERATSLAPKDTRPALRRTILTATTRDHIKGVYGHMFRNGALQTLQVAHQLRNALSNRWSRDSIEPHHDFQRLRRKDPKAAATTVELMKLTQHNIDPRKQWKEHTWLHEDPKKDQLKRLVDDGYRKYRMLRQKQAHKVYDDMLNVNESMQFAQQTASLYNLVQSEAATAPRILRGFRDPMDEYIKKSGLHGQPAKARAFWQERSEKLLDLVSSFSKQQRGLMAGMSTADADRAHVRLTELEASVRDIRASQKAMSEGNYFHLGRFGNYFVNFSLPLEQDADGKDFVSRAAIDRISEAFNKAGYFAYELAPAGDKTNVFIRAETQKDAEMLRDIAHGLQAKGSIGAGEITAGKRESSLVSTNAQAQAWVQRLIQSVEANPAFEPDPGAPAAEIERLSRTRSDFVDHVKQFALDMMPDTASAKVMVHRNFVPGFTSDMIRSHAFRTQVGAHALANISSVPAMMKAFTDMKSEVKRAQGERSSNVFAMQEVMDEFFERERQRPSQLAHTFVDTMRAVNHAYFLGMSPAYTITNLTQVGVILWPELAKKHGFSKSFAAITRATPLAFKIMVATLKAGVAMGPARAADATITETVLNNIEGLSASDKEFVLRMVNTGVIDIGSASREHGRISDSRMGSKTDIALRYASAFGLYSEMVTRLIAALSARDLANKSKLMESIGQQGRDDYAIDVIEQSMFNYTADNTARFAGPHGIAGPITPLALAFMKYTFMLTEKLYREFHTGFVSSNASAEAKAGSRRFMYAHLSAVTTLAGSLGLPFAASFARALEVLVDAFDDDEDPFDATASWRNFLADTFGLEVGEVLARGVPRAFNIDMSIRAGEQDLLPFSKMLTDKRDWETKIKDTAFRTLGSPLSMVTNIVAGGSKMASGNLLDGMKEVVPVAIKGPIEAYKMSDKGYTDAAGNVLPMEVGAGDLLAQLLGFSPSEKAEAQESKFAQQVRRGQLTATARNIRKNLAVAIESGDREAMREWLTEARKFDISNPAFDVVPGMAQTLRQRARARALGQVNKLPIGFDPRDPGAASLTKYANF